MSGLTDLEICKRIAEIKGVSYFEFPDCIVRTSEPDGTGTPQEAIGVYNPLTDDALCFQLMVKYEVDIAFNDEWCGIYNDYATKGVLFEGIPINKAICLAIIEANKLTLQKEGK